MKFRYDSHFTGVEENIEGRKPLRFPIAVFVSKKIYERLNKLPVAKQTIIDGIPASAWIKPYGSVDVYLDDQLNPKDYEFVYDRIELSERIKHGRSYKKRTEENKTTSSKTG